MRRLVLLAFSFILLSPPLLAQQNKEGPEEETARIEIAASSDKESYRTIACDRHGVMIFFKSVEYADAQRVKWYFSFYNTDMKQVWIKSLPILSDLEFGNKLFSGDTLMLFFVYNGKQKSEDQPLEIVRIALKSGNFIPNMTKVPANSEPVFFRALGRNVYLALNHRTGQAAIEILDLKSNHSKGFLIDQQSPVSIRWFEIDTSGFDLKAIITKPIGKKEVDHLYQVFDTTGKLQSSVRISTINNDRGFTGFRAVADQKGGELVIGSYRLNSGGASKKNKSPEGSTGLFTSLMVSGGQKNLNFINFLELKNISTILSTGDLLDLKKKALKKNKNISEYSVDFSILQHDPLEHDGNFIQISEVFFLQYHAENFTDFDFYGRPYTNSYSVFDGYRFTGAIITAFNSEGQLLWDNALEVRDLVSADLSPKVIERFQGDKILLAYNAGGKIGSKIIRNGETTGKLEFSMPELRYPDDKLVSETRSGLLPWYDNYFLCFGFQEIKNVALQSNNKRFVYYLTKIKLED